MSENTPDPTQYVEDTSLDSIPVGYTSNTSSCMVGHALFREHDIEAMLEDANFLVDNIGNSFMQW